MAGKKIPHLDTSSEPKTKHNFKKNPKTITIILKIQREKNCKAARGKKRISLEGVTVRPRPDSLRATQEAARQRRRFLT